MLFSKKLFLLAIGGVGTVAIGRSSFGSLGWYEGKLSDDDLQKIFELTKNAKDVILDPSLDSNIKELTRSPYIYSLFSTNLDTFTSGLKNHFYSWFLYEWANRLLSETKEVAFSDSKIQILEAFNKAEDKYKPNQGGDGTPFDTKHWTKENHLITETKEDLERIFLDFFFKSLYLKADKSAFEVSDIGQFGDREYIEAVAKFQEFVFKDWLIYQKPVFLCRKEWKLSSSFPSNEKRFKENKDGDTKKRRPDTPTIDWPDFHEVEDEIIKFNKDGLCQNYSLFTLEELSKLDGREIDAFVTKYFAEVKTDGVNPGVTQPSKLENVDDVYKLFIEDNKVNNLGLKLNESVIDSTGKLKDETNKYIFSFREVKFGSGKATYIKTPKGITFIWIDPKSKADSINDYTIKGNSPINDFSIEEQLKNYFKNYKLEVLGRYFESQKDKGVLFGHRSWSSSVTDLLISSSNFVTELRKNKEHWESMRKLSEAVKDYGSITYGEDKKLDFSAGLAVPTFMQRNLDKTTNVLKKEIKKKTGEPNTKSKTHKEQEQENVKELFKSIDTTNDGLFPWLKAYYSVGNNIDLAEKARELKEKIKDYINGIRDPKTHSENGRSSFFLNDYIFDNIYNDFITKEKGEFLKQATVSLMLVNEMKFQYLNNDLKGFADRLTKRIYLGIEDDFKELFEEVIKDVYYGSSYINEPMENRLNYGGFHYEKPENENKQCLRRLNVVDDKKKKAEEIKKEEKDKKKNGCEEKLTSNRNEWLKKVSDYWTLKNYVFSADGYELGSYSSNNYIQFLFSLYLLSVDNFSTLREFVISKIPTGRYGALVWMDDVSNVGTKINTNEEIGSEDNASKSIKSITSYFRNTRQTEIFHPFFSSKIEVEPTKEHPLTADHLSAFARVEKDGYLELYGFKGLFAERLNVKQLPEAVAKAIFSEFTKANPKGNKNYAFEGENGGDVVQGSAFGSLQSSADKDAIYEIVRSFKNMKALKAFLSRHLSNVASKVFKDISDSDYENSGSSKSLYEVQQMTLNAIKSMNADDKFKRMTSRFSGFLQNPVAEESVHSTSKFFIPRSSDSSNGYIIYITQVNQYDFGSGFAEFVDAIRRDAFIKMVVKLAANDQTKSSVVNDYLISKNMFI
ncbi:hypothetical protein MHSWG343_10370 [Candidatus Mycoplasma haematohominis]|uniref:Uncharacterized protein n=1 Tax=Candidatus Mycoplasma haematohominis TaxID=1494318 RepID=A0A478FUA7_9MOLU|nr:hypothetical protein MHSWG343_10370 [Candidatus Mycoplasma haemohominis]